MYAAKFIRCNGAAARLRAREEIDILSSLQHQNILRYIFHKVSLVNVPVSYNLKDITIQGKYFLTCIDFFRRMKRRKDHLAKSSRSLNI